MKNKEFLQKFFNVILKVIITLIYFIIGVQLCISFLDTVIHPDAMGINFIASLPTLPLSIFLIWLALKSTINIIKHNFKVTTIEKIILIFFTITVILPFIQYYYIHKI